MKKDAARTGIFGASGSGKTTRFLEMIEEQKLNRLIILDPMGDWKDIKGFKAYKTLKGLYTAMKQNWNGEFKLVLDVDEDDFYLPDILQQISRDLFIIQKPYADGKDKRKITLGIDEMADYYPNKTLAKDEQGFQKLCRKGRHYGVNIIGASQRLAEVHTSFRGNMSQNYYFRQGDAADVNRALQQLGAEYKPALQGLADHEYLLKSSNGIHKGKNKCNW